MVNLRINLEIIEDGERSASTFDLGDPNHYHALVLGFGNGIYDEVRAVAESKAGILVFANLLRRGGYWRGNASDAAAARLYQPGDEVFPEQSPFVFVQTKASNGETLDFEDFDAELAAL